QRSLEGTKQKPWIKSEVSIHDRTQVEVVFDYKLQAAASRFWQLQSRQKFEVEAFLFFPQPMGISPQNYSRSQFYDDLRPLLRLKEPRYSYLELLGVSEEGVSTPLPLIKRYLEALAQGKKAHTTGLSKEDVVD